MASAEIRYAEGYAPALENCLQSRWEDSRHIGGSTHDANFSRSRIANHIREAVTSLHFLFRMFIEYHDTIKLLLYDSN